MIEFIKENYSYILSIISCLLIIISFIFKSKSNNTSKKIFRIIQILPFIINKAENIFLNVSKSGPNKLEFVLNEIKTICSEVNLNYDNDFWIDKVEGFLSTPQKK